jgi:hypothetical protein
MLIDDFKQWSEDIVREATKSIFGFCPMLTPTMN